MPCARYGSPGWPIRPSSRERSAPQAAVVFGILSEKYLLEAGRPTSIQLNATVDATMPDVLARLKRVIEGMRKAEQAETAGDAEK